MYPVLAVLHLLAQGPAGPVDSAARTAYLDDGARDLVRLVRARGAARAAAITAYRAVVRERIFLGLRALRRDRVVYQRELAGRVSWHRDGPDTVVMTGARQAIPIVARNSSLPEDLQQDAPDLAFDPLSDRLGVGPDDSDFVYQPLAPKGEENYRFQSGGSVALGDIKLLELRVLARRDEFRLMNGSLWVDAATDEVVQAVFRPARPFDLERDVDVSDSSDANIPGFLKPIRGDVRLITIEYARWEGWWLPRLIAFDGVATVGSLLTLPLRYERAYSDYEVAGDTGTVVTAPRSVSPRRRRRHHSTTPDSTRTDSTDARDSVAVILPTDTASLLVSGDLPPPFTTDADAMVSEAELRDLAARLRHLPQPPAAGHGRLELGFARYNRVEGLSLAARGELGLGRLTGDAELRVGTADREPNGELGISRETAAARYRFGVYRRLGVANPSVRPLGLVNSVGALVFGRDDGAYYRDYGAELTVRPAPITGGTYDVRIFVEHQSAATKQTDASLAHLVDDTNVFPPNIDAAPATEGGAAFGMRVLGTDLQLDVNVGTFDFARFAATLRQTAGLPAGLVGGVELGAGTSAGEVPPQSLWYLGGPGTLRGYDGLAAAGESFWRARVELANAFPGARVALFSDAGWAGPTAAHFSGRALVAAGVGASFLDGLVRIDLARPLRSPADWRLDVYVDGIL